MRVSILPSVRIEVPSWISASNALMGFSLQIMGATGGPSPRPRSVMEEIEASADEFACVHHQQVDYRQDDHEH